MQEGISAGKFYGAERFRPPAFSPGTGQYAILKSIRNDPSRLYREFPVQQLAFDFCDKHPGYRLRVWGLEKDNKGRRKFCVASYEGFWRIYSRAIRVGSELHYYEVIRNHHASKLYFDLEYQLEHNPDARPEEMVDSLVTACAELCGLSSISRTDGSIVELDSTTDQKFSRHVIFQSIAFHDNIQAGDFAHRVVQILAQKSPELVLVKKSDGDVVPFVDLGVYTKNRCFRIVGSSKFGKTKRLLPMDGLCRGRVSVSKNLFLRSLICTVEVNVTLLGSVAPLALQTDREARLDGPAQGRPRGGSRVYASPFPLVDDYVHSIIGKDGGGIYGVTVLSGSEIIMYTIKGGYKYCANVGRHHKSNNVILFADLCKGEMYQKCFDPNCRGFRSSPWPLPLTLTSQTVERSPNTYIDENVSDYSLCDLMNKIEAAGSLKPHCASESGFDGDVNDDALNKAMDDLISKGLMQRGVSQK